MSLTILAEPTPVTPAAGGRRDARTARGARRVCTGVSAHGSRTSRAADATGRDGAATRSASDGGNVPDVPVADAVSDSADGCTKPSAACATDHQNARS